MTLLHKSDLLIPHWPAPANVHAAFTQRRGGVSAGPYASMNVGDHVGDDLKAVRANRESLAQCLQAQPVFLNQVHGCDVVQLDNVQGSRADASVTTHKHLACTIMVADCLPVLFTTQDGRTVAAAHAGWRGLANGILQATLEEICALSLAGNDDIATKILAWLGPCIGPTAFEVGQDVKDAFAQNDAFTPTATPGKYLANLPALARQRLQALGVSQIYGNDGTKDWCTVSNAAQFFSHRRDGGVTGRMAACIWIT